jgi:polyisoprenoid-binding protein YceI
MLKVSFIAVLMSLSSLLAQSTSWNFDKAHSQVKFEVTHLVISTVLGKFDNFDGTVKTNGDDFTDAEIEFTVETNSINTANDRRDNHLRSDDFFNAEKFPQMKFKSKSMRKIDENNYKLIGDLTIRNVTKEVELNVARGGMMTDNYGNVKAGFRLTGTINRFDFNLKWNALLEVGGAVVGPNVDIICDIQLVKEST